MNPESFEQSQDYQPVPVEGEKLPEDIIEKIESFEKRSSQVFESISDRENILLVKSGAKPTAIIEVYGDFEQQDVKEFYPEREKILKEEIKKVSDFLKDIRLFFKVGSPNLYELENEDNIIDVRQEFVDVLIAGNENSLSELSDGMQTDSHEKIGLALGYPKTAVEEFVGQREEMKKSDLPQEIKESEIYPFIEFRLSKNNWMHELETVKAWTDIIKKNSPKLFNETMKEFKARKDAAIPKI